MSLCDSCYNPGACCKDFRLNITFFDDIPIVEQLAERKKKFNDGNQDIPFIPVAKFAKEGETKGRAYSTWTFMCPWLQENGRCGNYENRPELCRSFEPATDPICVHYMGAEGTGEGL